MSQITAVEYCLIGLPIVSLFSSFEGGVDHCPGYLRAASALTSLVSYRLLIMCLKSQDQQKQEERAC